MIAADAPVAYMVIAAVLGITVNLAGGRDWPIPFFAPPKLDPLENAIFEAIKAAGEPLQQKGIAKAARVSLRLVQKATPGLVERGILLRHPTQGFYLPGMKVVES